MATLTADSTGKLTGRFTIPASVPAGSKSVVFDGRGGSHGEAVFTGQGKLTSTTLRKVTKITRWTYDPLAQTFMLAQALQLAGVDLWFTAKKSEVRVQLRETSNGVPTRTVLAEKALAPADIVATGGGHTRVLFDTPVTLEANTEYAIVVLCDDATTALAIAEMGKFDKTKQKWVSSQPYTVGVLLSSSNASSWTTHQDKDLAFRLLKANFNGKGSRTISLGSVDVNRATDLLLMAVDEIPSAQCRAEYVLVMPDGTRTTVASDQAITLASQASGAVGVEVVLTGDAANSPIYYPGAQLLFGTVAREADYYTRSIVARNATKAVLVFDALVPSGATVTPQLQVDGGNWKDFVADGATPGDDGVVEFRYRMPLSGAQLIKARLNLTGTSTARPVVRNVRLMAAM